MKIIKDMDGTQISLTKTEAQAMFHILYEFEMLRPGVCEDDLDKLTKAAVGRIVTAAPDLTA